MLCVYYDMSRNSTIKVHCMLRMSVVRKSRCLLNNNCNKQKYNLAHNPRDGCLYTITMMNLYVQSVVTSDEQTLVAIWAAVTVTVAIFVVVVAFLENQC